MILQKDSSPQYLYLYHRLKCTLHLLILAFKKKIDTFIKYRNKYRYKWIKILTHSTVLLSPYLKV